MNTAVGHVGIHMAAKAMGKVVDYLGRSDADTMKSLKRDVEMLSSRATDVEDEVKREEQSCKKKRKKEVADWLKIVPAVKVECDELEVKVCNSRLPLIGDPVGKLKNQVKGLIEQSNNFNELVLDDFDNIGDPCLPTKLFGNKIMGSILNKIWPCLIVGDISSIGIYGMGGVGKTTLAKHIKFELERSNCRVHWVTVSQEFSITSLQDKIANVLGIPLSNKDEEHMRANILRAAFNKMKKSVLILDDVWEDFLLEDVGIAIGANNCRLIWTTRSSQVCDRMRCQRRFKVPTLDERESWGLFKDTLGHETVLSTEVEQIAKSITNRCAGLPLGIVTTAASMRGVTDIHEWKNALELLKSSSDGYHEMEDKVFPILECSFSRLRGCEGLCFLYCSLYPEDHEIKREKLIDLFIFAELIPRRDTMELERHYGHAILNKLIKACLLEETESWGGVKCVRMHDLIRDMALRITSGKHNSKNSRDVPRFLVKSNIKKYDDLLANNEEWKNDLVVISLMAGSLYNRRCLELPPLQSTNCQNISTLIINDANITEIPDSFLQHMSGLKVLNLEGCLELISLPNCISNIVNLIALLLENCECLESVPPLGKLRKLRILNLFNTRVGDVPQGLEELVNLESIYMYMSELRPGARALPEGTFSKLHRLQYLVLPGFIVQISDLRALTGLQGYVGEIASIGPYIRFVTSGGWPRHYEIAICVNWPFDVDYDSHDYMRSRRLENRLWLKGCNYQNGLDMVLTPENLHWLEIDHCSGLSDVFFHRLIDRSKDLYHLTLRSLEELKFVLNFSSPDDCITLNLVSALPNLRDLSLKELPNLVGLINGRLSGSVLPGTFSCLEDLSIEFCGRLKNLFSVQLLRKSLQKLQSLSVIGCYELEEIVANNDDDEREAIIFQPSSSESTTFISHDLLLPKLQELTLRDLPKLKNVCGPTTIIGGVGSIRFSLSNCPKLKSLPAFSSTIKISSQIQGSEEWWNSLEWKNPSDKDTLQPYFYALEASQKIWFEDLGCKLEPGPILNLLC